MHIVNVIINLPNKSIEWLLLLNWELNWESIIFLQLIMTSAIQDYITHLILGDNKYGIAVWWISNLFRNLIIL